MKKIIVIFIFFNINGYCQKSKNISSWQATSENRNYQLDIKNDSIKIIANQYIYNYKIYNRKNRKYFIMDNEKICIREFSNGKVYRLFIGHCDNKLRESVNEIFSIEFKKM